MPPRAVLVDRPTAYEELLARHATRGQVAFFLRQRGLELTEVDERHARHDVARRRVLGAVPPGWRTATVRRQELDRFLFAEDDVVLVLGQDGLVANVARYVAGQPVLGLDPEHGRRAGVLTGHPPEACADLLADLGRGTGRLEERAMVRAVLDDGRELRALNEVFVGHRSHQSARYQIDTGDSSEHQSSSGVIISTGTGATGWCASLRLQAHSSVRPPRPDEARLAWFVREAWPSPVTGSSLTSGELTTCGLTLRSEGSLVCFGDGMESDVLELGWGQRVTVELAQRRLQLI